MVEEEGNGWGKRGLEGNKESAVEEEKNGGGVGVRGEQGKGKSSWMGFYF